MKIFHGKGILNKDLRVQDIVAPLIPVLVGRYRWISVSLGQPGLHSEFQNSQSHVERPYLKTKQKTPKTVVRPTLWRICVAFPERII